MFKGFSSSAQGASHIEKNIVCQDSAKHYCGETFGIAVVSDGHGSAKHFRSDIGASKAVEETIAAIKEFIDRENEYKDKIFSDNIKNRDEVFKQLEGNIIYRWNKAVCSHYDENEVTEEEAAKCGGKAKIPEKIESIYGATLIAAVMTAKYWFAIQIGDGACVTVIDDETAKIFVPDDERLVFGFTTSLCDSDAIDNFRYYFSEGTPKGIVVSSDGVADSFATESFGKFNIKILNLFMSQDNANEELEKLLPVLSERGSKDDVSVAGVYFDNMYGETTAEKAQ